MLCQPALIQKRLFSWPVDSTTLDPREPGYFARTQPAWDSDIRKPDAQRRVVLGWKVSAEFTFAAAAVVTSVRIDIGGGQTKSEMDDARPLVAFTMPTAYAGATGTFSPANAFIAPDNQTSWVPGNTGYRVTLAAWPGLSSSIPIWCEDNVQCLVRAATDASPEDTWIAKVNLTLWIGSQ